MVRKARTSQESRGVVVHVVGRVTDEVYSFLGPTSRTLARSGLSQSIIALDEQRLRQHVAQLDCTVDVVVVPPARWLLPRWRALFRACCEEFGARDLRAVHLHGFVPCLIGAFAVRRMGVSAPLIYSPHASRSVGRLHPIGSAILWLLKPVLGIKRNAVIVNMPQEAFAFNRWKSVDIVESPISDEFFKVPRHEARHPLIVTGGRGESPQAAQVFTQLAVLLGGDSLKLSFNWIGSVDPLAKKRLTTAGVGVFDCATDAEVAARLAAGWIYVAPGASRGFPLFLLEAMATGLPCVAMTSSQFRDVITNGETGFLCESEEEMVEYVALLSEDAELRARIGQAAREAVRHRFHESKFRAKLLAAYDLPASVAHLSERRAKSPRAPDSEFRVVHR